MADALNLNPASRRQSSGRLQKRAPASIQVSPATEWNVAIPLLSPLIQSPPALNNLTDEMNSCCSNRKKETISPSVATVAERSAVVMKKWQHPAHPFCYQPSPILPFVCSGNSDR